MTKNEKLAFIQLMKSVTNVLITVDNLVKCLPDAKDNKELKNNIESAKSTITEGINLVTKEWVNNE